MTLGVTQFTGHIIIGQLHYLSVKKVEQSIIVLGILTLTIPLHQSTCIMYGSFLNLVSIFLNFIARNYNAFLNKIFLFILLFSST